MRTLLVAGAVVLVVGAGVGGGGPTEGPPTHGASAPAAGGEGRLVEGHTALVVLETGSGSSSPRS